MLAFIDIDTSITLVTIAHIVVSLLMSLLILMQRPKQEGLGAAFGSGMTDAAWGARTTDVLQKGTVYLGTLFFIFSLVLAIMIGKRNSIKGKNYASDGGSTAKAPVEAPANPISPIAPLTPPDTDPVPPVDSPEPNEPNEPTEPTSEESNTPPSQENTPAPEEETPAPTGETPTDQ